METKSTRKTWKQKILDFEFMKYKNLCGIEIKVTNIKILKYHIIADVKIIDDDVETMYRGCSYTKEYLK